MSGFDQEPASTALALTADVAGAGQSFAGLTSAWIQARVAATTPAELKAVAERLRPQNQVAAGKS